MVREDILGGLSSALARGQSLKQAMMSFYNAGYVKGEIEEAAKALNSGITSQPKPIQQPPQTIPQQNTPTQVSTPAVQKISAYGAQPQQQIVPQQVLQKQPIAQNVSAYGQPQKPKGKLAIFVLVFFLILLLGALATLFFFKDELLSFFGS